MTYEEIIATFDKYPPAADPLDQLSVIDVLTPPVVVREYGRMIENENGDSVFYVARFYK